jgi:methionyl aminopeptidase
MTGAAMVGYSENELDKFRKAGEIAGRARDFGLSLIEPGASHLAVSRAVEEEIRRLGGEPAFPAQISLNNIAAHYCSKPSDPLVFKEGDIAKLDVGAHVDGYVGDTAASRDLGGHGLLVEASRRALLSAIAAAGADVPIRELSRAIQSTITSMGFKPVSNLTGHAVGHYQIHGSPQIPNVPEFRTGKLLKGMVIAIEPFASDGRGVVHDKGSAEIFSARKKLRHRKGMDRAALDAIAAYNGLPFARRNLVERFDVKTVNNTLREMQKSGMLHSYPPLAEPEGTFLSQAEHTIYIGDKVEVLTE